MTDYNHEAQDLGYPMQSYVAAWKTYRTLSNEDDQIARKISHYVKLKNDNVKILDIGPGDGRVLLRTLIRLDQAPKEVKIIEPNQTFVDETIRAVNYDRFLGKLDVIPKKLEACSDNEISGYDLILCTHTAYFLTNGELVRLLDQVEKGARLIVILDHPDSVFAKLWQRTAPDFYRTARNHTEKLRSLSANDFDVKISEVEAEIGNPSALRQDIKNLVLSMLCYADVDDMPHEELVSVEHTISDLSNGTTIPCLSYLFDITKHQA